MEVKEYSSLDQLLWTEADEVEFILYHSVDYNKGYDEVPVFKGKIWTRESEEQE